MTSLSAAGAADLVIDTLCAAAERNQAPELSDCSELSDSDPRADFDCVDLPGVTLKDYCRGFSGTLNLPELWPQVLIFIDKLCRVAGLSFHPYNAHRLVLTTFCIAIKVSSDYCGVSPIVARLGGVHTADLISMEVSFLFLMDWRVNISGRYYRHILQQLPNIKAAALLPGAGVELIPDKCVPPHLRIERLSEQPVLHPEHDDSCQDARRSSRTGAPLMSSLLCSSASLSAVSAVPYEVTSLVLLPMPAVEDALGATVPGPDPAVPIRPRRVSLSVAIDVAGDATQLPVSPRALGRSRSGGGRFSSAGLRTPSAPSPRQTAAVPDAQPPPAAVPRQPQQPRPAHGPRPSHGAQSAPAHSEHCSSPTRNRTSMGIQSAPASPPPPGGAASSATGKRARIEAARAFTQEDDDMQN